MALAVPATAGSTIVPGFNVDGRVSDASDATTCGHADFTSPPPDNSPGVDNQLGAVAKTFGLDGQVSDLFQTGIAAGQLLLMVELDHVQDAQNDSCVTAGFLSGRLPTDVALPALEPDGTLAPGQSFDLDGAFLASDGTPLYAVQQATITGGVLDTGLTSLSPTYPVAGIQVPLTFNRLRVTLSGDRGSDGLIGGSVSVDAIASLLDAGLGTSNPLVIAALRTQADLDRDASGTCQSLSTGLTFDAVSAVRGSVR